MEDKTLDPLDMGSQADVDCPRQEWQMLLTAEPSLQLLCHAPVLQRSSNDHLVTFPLLPLLLQSLSAYCLKYETNQYFSRLMKIQSTGKQNPTIKELSMKLAFKIHVHMCVCVYVCSIYSILHISYYIW